MVFRKFPYTNFHEINLDWIISVAKELEKEWEYFKVDWGKDVQEQVFKWLDEHPEATTTVLDGAISTVKLHNNAVTFDKMNNDALEEIYDGKIIYEINDRKIITNRIKPYYNRYFVSRKPLSYYTNDANFTYLQSAEYIDSLGHYILGFCTADYTTSMLVEVDVDFTTIIRRSASISLGHVNDLTYNPSNNKLYCAVMGTGTYANKIVVIDIPQLTISDAIDIGDTVYQISYDRQNNVYYVGTHNNGIYDENFTLLKNFPKHSVQNAVGEPVTDQGSVVIDGTYIMLDNAEKRYYFSTFNYDTGEIEQIQEYPKTLWFDEVEALVNNNGVLYTFSGQRYVTIFKTILDVSTADIELASMFDNGIELVAGDDLNDIYEPGAYFCRSSSIATELTNVPSQMIRGFKMYVLTIGYDSLVQLIMGQSSEVIWQYRTRIGNNDWNEWKNPTGHFTQQSIGGPVAIAGGTIQIPTDILNTATVITIVFNRGNRCGSITIPKVTITNGECADGVCIMSRNDRYWNFTISNTGLITINSASGVNDPYVRIVYS